MAIEVYKDGVKELVEATHLHETLAAGWSLDPGEDISEGDIEITPGS